MRKKKGLEKIESLIFFLVFCCPLENCDGRGKVEIKAKKIKKMGHCCCPLRKLKDQDPRWPNRVASGGYAMRWRKWSKRKGGIRMRATPKRRAPHVVWG